MSDIIMPVDNLDFISLSGDTYRVTMIDGHMVTETDYVQELNNTYTEEGLTNSLQIIKRNCFDYLLNFQKNICSIKRQTDTFNNIKEYFARNRAQKTFKKVYLSIDIEFVLSDRRKTFMHNGYNNSEISLNSILTDNKVFHLLPKVFIGNKLVNNYKVKCKEDKTLIIFSIGDSSTDSFTKTFYNEAKTNNYDITTIFLPKTNIIEMSSYLCDGINPTTKELFAENKTLPRIYKGEIREIVTDQEYFIIPSSSYPVDPSSMIAFIRNGTINTLIHNLEIELFYPNIYRIKNMPSQSVSILYYYRDNVNNSEWRNDLKLYTDNHSDILTEYVMGTVPDYIKQYKPSHVEYSIADFRNSPFTSPTEYRKDVFQRMIDSNGLNFEKYLYDTIVDNGMYLDVSKVEDLNSRVRTNNISEIDDIAQQETFAEERYLFIYRRELSANSYKYRMFIDGKHYMPDKHFHDDKYDFLYIQKSLITSNTLISVERIFITDLEYTTIFTSLNQELTVSIDAAVRNVLATDILFVGEDGLYLPRDSFRIYTVEQDNVYNVNIDSKAILTGMTFHIALIDSTLLNRQIRVVLSKGYETHTYTSADFINGKTLRANYITPFNKNRVCVLRNGKVLPLNSFTMTRPMTYKQVIDVTLSFIPSTTDIITVEVLPVTMREVVFIKQLDNNYGFLDMKGLCDKPINLSWYDIYVNGIKIDKNHIQIITPFKAILKNVDSLKNISFIEIDRDKETFVLKMDSISDTIWQNELSIRELYLSTTIVDNSIDITV